MLTPAEVDADNRAWEVAKQDILTRYRGQMLTDLELYSLIARRADELKQEHRCQNKPNPV